MKQKKSFGKFGSGKPILRKKSRWATLGFYGGFILVVIVVGPPLWSKASLLYRSVVEREAPVIEFGQLPRGIGVAPVEISIKVSDAHSGLDEVVVQLEQSRSITELTRRNYSRAQSSDRLLIKIDPQALGVVEGEVTLVVRVFDKSLWSNLTHKSVQFVVDYQAPRIELLSHQHNVVEGGVELVFYRLPSDPNAFSGVVVDTTLFPGFPAITLDESFSPLPDVYFSFFAVPGNAKDNKPKITLIARDEVGNTTSSPVPFRVIGRKKKTERIRLTREMFLRVIDQTYQQYLEFSSKYQQSELGEFYPTISNDELRERFQQLITTYAEAVEQEAKVFFSRPKQERFWKGTFGRPIGRPFSTRFFENLEWMLGSELIGRTRQTELWFLAREGKEVSAANNGKVIFADTFGIYGTTVILDHGFGLTTLYTHLSSVGCAEGDELRKGALVGLTGSSGLQPYSGSGFQLRLHGVPIRPEEWWDERWLKEHIDKKVLRVLRDLGIQPQRALEGFGALN